MSALYRQARPTTFDEMVGQEHVKEVLNNALRQGKLAQAYLFSGPRGVGKTSSARLIAQAVNCSGPEPRPCGVCEGCRLVREGRHPDVMEIDAASNNSVEDVRNLRERILLAPILSPQEKKVVILDEAHMMSKSAFNALLKTLEEPPPHVIFIFATTEPERMPATILSRTQHFRFRRLSEAEIVQKLSRILQSIERQAEPAALGLVARMADGAMRDAESLMDRLLTLDGPITLKQTESALGLPPQEALFGVAEAVDRGEIKSALEQASQLYTQGFAARTLAQGLLEAIRAGLYGRMGLGTGPHLTQPEDRLVGAMTALDETLERLLKRSDALSLELAVLAAYQALHQGSGSREPAPEPRAIQQSTAPSVPDFDPRPRRPIEGQGSKIEGSNRATQSPNFHPETQSPNPAPSQPNIPTNVRDLAGEWRAVMGALKMTIRGFVREAEPRFDEGKVTLIFAEKNNFHFENSKKNLEDIKRAVREVMGIGDVELMLGKKKLTDEPSSSRPFSPQPGLGSLAAQVVEAAKPVEVERPRLETPHPPVAFEDLGQPPKSTEIPTVGIQRDVSLQSPEHINDISGVEAHEQALALASLTPSQPDLPPPATPTPQLNLHSELPPPLSPSTPLLQPPPLLEDWIPEDTPFGESEPFSDEEAAPIAKTETQANLLDDPKFKSLVKLFGGRLRKFYKDTPKEAAAELEEGSSSTAVLEGEGSDEA